MPFGAKPAPARGEGSAATATAQPSPPPGTFRRRGPQRLTINRTSLAPGRERLPPRSAKSEARQPVPWGLEGQPSPIKGRTFPPIRQRFTPTYRETAMRLKAKVGSDFSRRGVAGREVIELPGDGFLRSVPVFSLRWFGRLKSWTTFASALFQFPAWRQRVQKISHVPSIPKK